MAGFTVGVVDKDKMTDRRKVREGDILIALPSSGVHSNGFSLVRKIINDHDLKLGDYVEEFSATLGETLLTPTKIYAREVNRLMENIEIHSIAHITGGAYYEKLPRSLADGISAKISRKDIKVLPVIYGVRV